MKLAPVDNQNSIRKAYLMLFIAACLFAGNVIAGKVVSSEMPSLGLSAIRAVFGLMILVPLAWPQLKNTPFPTKQELKQMFILGFFGITMAYITFLIGIRYTTGTNASIIIATTPAVTNALIFVFNKTKPSKPQIMGIITSFLGLIIVFTQGSPKNIFAFNLGIGDLILFGNVLAIAFFNNLGQGITQKFSSLVTSVYALALNTILLIPLGAWQLATYDWHLSFSGWLVVMYMGFIVTGGAFFLNLYGVSKIGGGQASIFSNLQPVVSILLSVIILGESLAIYHLIGFALVLSGIMLSLSKPPELKSDSASLPNLGSEQMRNPNQLKSKQYQA
ncbi:MAG: DMT family transporter [Desulfitobacterium hafniense]|nr:DMT family transporter [Desulfitobacterium hafniense]